ncbi:hypothetical protein TNCV_5065191 [Trichonephila clavipes]|nr:hypothetical protein TNCV_5065191 [Trichonephila clavipes]
MSHACNLACKVWVGLGIPFLCYPTPQCTGYFKILTIDDRLNICVKEAEEIVDLLKPMDSDSDAEYVNRTSIKTDIFSNVLHCLETETI